MNYRLNGTHSEVVETLQVGARLHAAGVQLRGLRADVSIKVEENIPLYFVRHHIGRVHDDVP